MAVGNRHLLRADADPSPTRLTGADTGPERVVDGADYTQGRAVMTDDGPGIPADQRDTVFDSGQTLSMEGTGFGLAIAEQTVEAHDWSISPTESEAGGARFEMRF